MSTEEIRRSEILRMVDEWKITQKIGAKRIDVTARDFRRLLQRYRAQGPEGIISDHRGKPSNNHTLEEK